MPQMVVHGGTKLDLAIAMKYGNKHLKMAKIQVFNVSCTFSTNFRCISQPLFGSKATYV